MPLLSKEARRRLEQIGELPEEKLALLPKMEVFGFAGLESDLLDAVDDDPSPAMLVGIERLMDELVRQQSGRRS